MNLFRTREVKKEYLAVVTGKPARDEWTEKCYLSEILEKKGRVEVVRAGGRISETRFEVLGHSKGLSLVRCFPKTGRTHQIRVHLEKANTPIFGDKVYGLGMAQDPIGMESLAVKRHFLHASLLSFLWEDVVLEVKAEIPPDFKSVLNKSGLTRYLIS
jgi:23S rRNA-/tRNA-specific pseudouridylate synthase